MIFVTALINIKEDRATRGLAMRMAMFQKLVATGIYLHVFVDPEYADLVHVPRGVVECIDFRAMDTYKAAPQGLPEHRSEEKDTRDFMILMNAKLEFLHRCMATTQAQHYAWIDFSVFNVLTDAATPMLAALSTREFPSTCIYFPGCTDPAVVWHRVNWRFCGGFFLGDRTSLGVLYAAFLAHFSTIPNLCWEVNVWAFLEQQGHSFGWYPGDHNDTLLALPELKRPVPIEI